jgi:hypothetical protein
MKTILFILLTVAIFAQNDYKGCPETGTPSKANINALNVLKNRAAIPAVADFDTTVTLEAMLITGDDTKRWTPAKAGQITGQIKLVKTGGAESCNCGMKDDEDRDAHIEIVSLTHSTLPVIVEVTPRIRAQMKARGIDWSTKTLKSLVGSIVTVQGWLFYDAEHKQSATNTAPAGKHNWRATAWEIHPVTYLKVVK